MRTIGQGTSSGINDEVRQVVSNQGDWEGFWAGHTADTTPARPLPAINFDESMVVAVFTGIKPTGGYSVEIKGVANGKVTFETKSPQGGMVTQALTQPFHIVLCPKVDGELEFEGKEAAPPPAAEYTFNVCVDDDNKGNTGLHDGLEAGLITFTRSMFGGKIRTIKIDASKVQNKEEAAQKLKVPGVTSVELDR